MTTHHSVEEFERVRLAKHLDALKERLVSEYGSEPGLTGADVVRLFEQTAAHFDGAAVTAFLPILIERRVRKTLGRRRGAAA